MATPALLASITLTPATALLAAGREATALFSLTWLEIGLIALVLLLGFMIWVLTRHQECSFDGEPSGTISAQLPALAGSSHGLPVSGNAIEIIQNEAFFDSLCAEIGKARATVHLETFLWRDGSASDRLSEALLAARQRDVTVRILTDARGSSDFSKAARERLSRAGCKLDRFHRWRPRNLGKFNVRDHRKLAIIDGCTAFVGGHCIQDRWLLDEPERGRRRYRDISVRLTGPIVAQVQSTFFENWQEVSGELFTAEDSFPELSATGDITAHLCYVRADGCPSSVQNLHYLAIGFAKKSIRIQNPYFLPDLRGVDALVRAVKRGVDVRVMTPSVDASDTPYVQRASHFLFRRLLEGGVKIYEYQPTLLHQKIITVDGEWCGIGSSNFDDRSFKINDEVTLGIADGDTAERLDAIFEKDLAECRERELDEWRQRPHWTRAVDFFYYLFNEQL